MEEARVHPAWPLALKLFVSACLLVLAVFLAWRFSITLTPVILAAILAYVLSPIVGWLEARTRMRRGWATVVVYLVLIGLAVIGPVILIPRLIEEGERLNLNLGEIFKSIETFMGKPRVIGGYTFGIGQLLEQLMQYLQTIGQPFFGRTLGVAFEVVGSLAWTIFILITSFYFIKDSAKLRAWAESLAPISYRQEFVALGTQLSRVWSAFFRGQLVLAFVVASGFTVVGAGLGLPYALAMGVLAGLLEFLPSLGHGIWLLIATLLILYRGSSWIPLQHWVVALIVIGLHLLFEQFDLNYLIPRIVGREVRLHPLVVIWGVVAGALLGGVLGILLAAPTIASARVLLRYVRGYLFDEIPGVAG